MAAAAWRCLPRLPDGRLTHVLINMTSESVQSVPNVEFILVDDKKGTKSGECVVLYSHLASRRMALPIFDNTLPGTTKDLSYILP